MNELEIERRRLDLKGRSSLYTTPGKPCRLGSPCSKAVATACEREVTSSFEKMLSTWNRTVRSVTPRILAISQFVFPFFIQFRIVNSRTVSCLTHLSSTELCLGSALISARWI